LISYAGLVLIFVAVIGTWAALWLLARRLHHAFPSEWDRLDGPPGRPTFRMTIKEGWRDWKANVRLMIFVCTRQYIELQDRRVAVFVWCARICFALGLVALVLYLVESFSRKTIHF